MSANRAARESPQSAEQPSDRAASAPAADVPGISLDELNAAMAQLLSAGEDPYSPGAPESPLAAALAPAAGDSTCPVSPETILEAMLFVGGSGVVTAENVAGLMRGVRPAEIDAAVRTLNRQYAARRCPYRIESVGSGYRLILTPAYAGLREKVFGKTRQARLSQAAIEVLAAVAYHEPITAEQVARLRGTASGSILSQLVRRGLLKVERHEGQRSARYLTTPRFLELFRLGSLQDLPRSQDLEQPG